MGREKGIEIDKERDIDKSRNEEIEVDGEKDMMGGG